MEREGNTAEQPIAPESDMITNTTQNNQTVDKAPTFVAMEPDNKVGKSGAAESGKKSPNNKIIKIIVGIVAAIVLVVVGIAIGAAIVVNNRTNFDSNGGRTSMEDVSTTFNQLVAESDIDGIIEYVNNIANAYNSGSAKNITSDNMGNIYTNAMFEIAKSTAQDPNQRNTYGPTILQFAYAAEDLLHSADSAGNVYIAEYNFGSEETGEKYRLLSIERGSDEYVFDSNGKG